MKACPLDFALKILEGQIMLNLDCLGLFNHRGQESHPATHFTLWYKKAIPKVICAVLIKLFTLTVMVSYTC